MCRGALKGLCAIQVFCDFEPWPRAREVPGQATIKVLGDFEPPGHYGEIRGRPATTPRSGPPPQEQTPRGLTKWDLRHSRAR